MVRLRLSLRMALLGVAVLGLLVWAGMRFTIWYVRRPTYRCLAEYHRTLAHDLEYRIGGEVLLERDASAILPDLLAHPKLDAREVAPLYLRETAPAHLDSPTFHPFSGPRSGWAAAIAAHRAMIDHLTEEASYHSRLRHEYERAYSSFFAAGPP
jgi:hypothetical protein